MSTNYNPSIVTTGLVLCLDAANIKSYPGSGTIWYDLSGYGNHATLYNSPTFSNNRAYFSGVSPYPYAMVPYNQNCFTFSYEQTIMIILSPQAPAPGGARRNPYNQSYGGSGTWTHEPSGNINFYYGASVGGVDSTPYTAYSSAAVSQNETAIMTSVRSASRNVRQWFKNGSLTYSESNVVYNPVSNSTSAILIGTGYAGSYIGYIDMVLVYNIALTSDQVSRNFNALRGRYGL